MSAIRNRMSKKKKKKGKDRELAKLLLEGIEIDASIKRFESSLQRLRQNGGGGNDQFE